MSRGFNVISTESQAVPKRRLTSACTELQLNHGTVNTNMMPAAGMTAAAPVPSLPDPCSAIHFFQLFQNVSAQHKQIINIQNMHNTQNMQNM
jgi:hypothetical protein